MSFRRALATSWAALTLTFAVACRGERTLFVPLPPTSGDTTLILAFTGPDRSTFLSLAEIPKAGAHVAVPTPAGHDPWDRTDVVALLYGCPPDALGLATGNLGLVASGGAPLRPGKHMFSARADRGRLSDWQPLDALPPELAALRLEATPTGCLPFETQAVTMDLMGGARLVLGAALDDSHALLATEDGRFFTLDATPALVPLTGISTATPHLAAFPDPDGDLWLVGPERYAKGTPERGFVSMGKLAASVTYPVRISGPRSAEVPFELFIVDGTSSLQHFDGKAWSLVHDGVPPYKSQWGVAWGGPNLAAAAGVLKDHLLYDDKGDVLEETPDGVDSTYTVAFAPRIGFVSAGSIGVVHVRSTDGHWAPLAAITGAAVRLIYVLKSSFLFGGRFGVFTEYDPSAGQCPPMNFADHEVDMAFPFGVDRHVLVALPDSADRQQVVIISRTSKQEGCF